MYRRRVVNRIVRPCAKRSRSSGPLPLAAVGCALALAVTGCNRSAGTAAAVAVAPPGGSTYTLMQKLSALLAQRAAAHTVIFGGDVNCRPSCAPHGFWTRRDISAHQNPEDQHVYGTAALRSPAARVLPAIHTDHDVLLVRAHLTGQR